MKLLTLIAVLAVAWLVNKKGEDTEDSLFKLGNRLRTLEDDVQELKQSLQAIDEKLAKGAASKPAPAKKAPAKKKAAKKS